MTVIGSTLLPVQQVDILTCVVTNGSKLSTLPQRDMKRKKLFLSRQIPTEL